MNVIELEVPADAAGERLDRFLAAQPQLAGAHLSRTRLKCLIEDGALACAGQALTDPSARLRGGERLALAIPEARAAQPAGENIPLDVIFEDEHLLVIDKPAGLVVHPAAGHEDGTLVNALIAHCGASLSGIGGVKRPGIVHRLDKDTSGLLVVAKTDAAHQGLAALFADHGREGSLVREYRALVWGVPARTSGTVDATLGRHAHHREKMAVVPESRGRHAVTHYRVLERFGAEASLMACLLETGRTHQIRVHMAHIGHPLMGDATYGQGFRTKIARLPPDAADALNHLGRQALHAAVLGFDHPVTGETLHFESPLPQDMAQLAETMRQLGF